VEVVSHRSPDDGHDVVDAPTSAPRSGITVDPVAGLAAPMVGVRERGRLGRRIGLWTSIAWIALLVFVALFADLLPLHPYDRFTDLPSRTAPGWRGEFLGTDSLRRSVLSRLIYGARQSLQVGLVSVALAAFVGSVIGLTAGYLRGRVDEAIGVLLDTLLAIPALVLLLAIAAIGSRNVTTLIVGLSILLIAPFARLVRAGTVAHADREFVMAARAMGSTRRRIMFREILPNVVPGVVSVVFLYAASVIVAEGTLSFLGLGIPPPTPSWGGMINDGRQFIKQSPSLVFVPSAVLLLTVLSLRRVGEEIRIRLGAGSVT
jgi:peptide/nickel transport system permease protein